MKTIILLVTILFSTLSACGDDADGGGQKTYVKPDGSTCGDGSRSGLSSCTASANGECQAGQYCNSEQLTCSDGCLSDNNCAGNQYCDLTAGTGTCRNCTLQEPTVNPGGSACDDGGAKVRACGASAADTATFIGFCKESLADEEFASLMEAVLDCIDLAGTDCAEQTQCLSEDEGDEFEDGFDEGFDPSR